MIRTQNVEVVYGTGTRALAPTTLTFSAGAFVVLLGSSGAGKSTLLRSLNALVRPSAGDVVVEGIGALRTGSAIHAHRRRTGMIFQQHQLIGRRSVLDNVLTGRLGYYSGLRTLLPLPVHDRRLALQALERVGMLDYALRRADQLSGGQQQRVGIARALVQQPTLILADEPVASLDPATADRVLDLLHGICKADGIGAVVSLHQLDFAKRYADRIVGLAQGQVVFDGAPARLGKHDIERIYGSPTAGAQPASADDINMRKTGTYS